MSTVLRHDQRSMRVPQAYIISDTGYCRLLERRRAETGHTAASRNLRGLAECGMKVQVVIIKY